MHEIYQKAGNSNKRLIHCGDFPTVFTGLREANKTTMTPAEISISTLKRLVNTDIQKAIEFIIKAEMAQKEKSNPIENIEVGGKNSFHNEYVFKGTKISDAKSQEQVNACSMKDINNLFIKSFNKVMITEKSEDNSLLENTCLAIQKAVHSYGDVFFDKYMNKGFVRSSKEAIFSHNLLKAMGFDSYLVASNKCMVHETNTSTSHLYNVIKMPDGYYIFDPANPRYLINKNSDPSDIKLLGPALYKISDLGFGNLQKGKPVRVTHSNDIIKGRWIGSKDTQRIYGGTKPI